MRNAKRFLLILLLVTMLLSAGGNSFASAQTDNEPTGFKNVQLFIYPEYDDPRLLVMLMGQIEGVEAPAKVRFLVPVAAEMYSAGSIDAEGRYTGGPPDRQPSEIPGWDEISYELTTDTFRVEYYHPIIFGGPEKSISYDFRWLYPISGLSVIIQQPRTALDLRITPASDHGFLDTEGLNSYLYTYESLDDESPLHFDITYYKSDQKLSVGPIANTGAGGIPGTTLALIAGVILILSALGFIWYRSRTPRTRSERRRAKDPTAPGRPSVKGENRYCTQCGTSINDSYKFCPDCGTALT